MIPTRALQKKRSLLGRTVSLGINKRLKENSNTKRFENPTGFGAVRINDLPLSTDSRIEVCFPSGIHLAIKGDANLKELFELINQGF